MARKIDRQLSDKVTHILFSRREDVKFLSDLASALGTSAMAKVVGTDVGSKADAGNVLADAIPLSKDLLGKVWDAVGTSIAKLGRTAFSDRIRRRVGKANVSIVAPRRNVKVFEGSVTQRLERLRKTTVKETLKRCFRYGAPGGTTIKVTLGGTPSYSVSMEKNWDVYKGAYKGWAANADHHFVTVPTDWLSTVRNRGLAIVDGMMTLSASPASEIDGIEVYKAVWARQGRGYDVVTAAGFIARSGKAVAHGKTSEEAVRQLMKALPKRGAAA